eukprot:CAMPEP_0181228580 /NCGR_PEP_ID=MMETSP1096-20121128/33424_1 /TAXON_ID=156174 ORGANISM="Chrysochromulina ericina, Strain CCMP281" /NCGR_SAMPLE_ID=MMETSP1096 /ASSEMBLY_ACC=CAM_ASM_000453 /LENGTH=60 /DNA_ID=CAMNT_0023322115 /DNA_START=255 /DNA_END=437 /DNA_ORIENTATION=+
MAHKQSCVPGEVRQPCELGCAAITHSADQVGRHEWQLRDLRHLIMLDQPAGECPAVILAV